MQTKNLYGIYGNAHALQEPTALSGCDAYKTHQQPAWHNKPIGAVEALILRQQPTTLVGLKSRSTRRRPCQLLENLPNYSMLVKSWPL